MSLTNKCPVCDSNSILEDAKPVPSEGFYSKVYRCEKGHVFRIKTTYKGIKRTTVEVLEGGEDGSINKDQRD